MKKFSIVLFMAVFVCGVAVQKVSALPPTSPSLVVATQGTTVTLTWSAVGNPNGYTLFYAPYPDVSYIGSIDMGGQTSVSCNLPAGSAFYIAIQAYNNEGNSGFSNIEHFITGQQSGRWVIDRIVVNSPTSSGTMQYFYDSAGNNTRITAQFSGASSYTVNISYNSRSLVAERKYLNEDGSATTSVYTYDPSGNNIKTVTTDSHGSYSSTTTFTNEYDSYGNVVSGTISTVPGGYSSSFQVTYEYGSNGNPISERRYDDGRYSSITNHTYDSLGRQVKAETTVFNPYGNDTSIITTFTYDQDGNMATVTTGDTVSHYYYKML